MDSSDDLIELIFTKCSLVYGREFLGRWEGWEIDDVKTDWKRELGGFLNQPQRIKHGLENLPQRPPTALHFREICREARIEQRQQPLIEPEKGKPNQKLVERLVARAGQKSKRKPMKWAYDLQERERRGETLSIAQATMWRAALARHAVEQLPGSHSSVDVACLPPAMRPTERGAVGAREHEFAERFGEHA